MKDKISYLETCDGSFTAVTDRQIRRMTRRELIEHLESRGVACYDDESTTELRDCAIQDLETN